MTLGKMMEHVEQAYKRGVKFGINVEAENRLYEDDNGYLSCEMIGCTVTVYRDGQLWKVRLRGRDPDYSEVVAYIDGLQQVTT